MEWKGRQLQTIGELMSFGIDSCETPEEAREFMRLYREFTPFAAFNIGYLSGYYGNDDRKRIQEWFDVRHPYLALDVTPDDALRAGNRVVSIERRSERNEQ